MTEKKEHPNAMLLRWIADGEQIQVAYNSTWKNTSANDVFRGIVSGITYRDDFYRVKPKTIRIGKYDVAEPMKEKLVTGTQYFYITALGDDGISDVVWDNDLSDNLAVSSQMAWLNREDAMLAAKAIKEFLTGQ